MTSPFQQRVSAWFNHRGAFWTALIGLIAAFVGLISAIVTLHSANGDLSNSVDSLQRKNVSLRHDLSKSHATNDALQQIIDSQQAQIADLQKRVPPVIQPSDVPPIRSSNRVTVGADGDSIDLNSTAMNWNGGNVDSSDDDALSYSTDYTDESPSLYLTNVDSTRLPRDPDPTATDDTASYKTCAAASGYQPVGGEYGYDGLDPTTLQDDRTCFRLASGRYATIHADKITDEAITLSITVWQSPDD